MYRLSIGHGFESRSLLGIRIDGGGAKRSGDLAKVEDLGPVTRKGDRPVVWLVPVHIDVFGNLPFKIEDGTFVIGRTVDCDVTIVDETLSRRHARLSCADNGNSLLLEDLGSRNGTFVNGVKIERCNLTAESIIRLGAVKLRLTREIPLSVAREGWEQESTEEGNRKTGRHMRRQPLPRVLTTAQREVCALLLEGLDEPTIASQLKRSVHTVHNHVRKIYRACNVHSREQLMAKLLRRL